VIVSHLSDLSQVGAMIILYGKCVSELTFGNIHLSRVVLLGAATDESVRTR